MLKPADWVQYQLCFFPVVWPLAYWSRDSVSHPGPHRLGTEPRPLTSGLVSFPLCVTTYLINVEDFLSFSDLHCICVNFLDLLIES